MAEVGMYFMHKGRDGKKEKKNQFLIKFNL